MLNFRNRHLIGPVLFLVGLTVFLIALNVISTAHHVRLDLTRDQRHTLSKGSRQILSQVQSPVTISYYFSQSEKQVPQPIKDFAGRVSDVLREFEIAGNGMIKVRRFDAKPESDIEDTIMMAGIEPQSQLNDHGYYYLGIQIACIDQSVILPTLEISKEKNLEYDVSRAIMSVSRPDRNIVGLLSGLPITGSGSTNPFHVRSSMRPWKCVQDLKKDYEVKVLDNTLTELPNDLDVLLLVHPKELSKHALYLIDQYILRGGHLIAFLDPMCSTELNSRRFGAKPDPTQNRSDLGGLLANWGINYAIEKVVVDPGYAVEKDGTQPAFIELDSQALSRDDVITAALNKIMLPYTGFFQLGPDSKLTKSTLIQSSTNARAVDSKAALILANNPREFNKLIDKTDRQQVDIALKVNGKFPVGFTEEIPVGLTNAPEHLTSATAPATMVLVGDVDLLEDRIWSQRIFNRFTGRETTKIRNDNNTFLQNTVDQLAGGDDLISIRSRVDLPEFTRINRLRNEADERLRDEILNWQKQDEETGKRLKELKAGTDRSQEYIESPELRRERDLLNRERRKIGENIKRLNRESRQSIDRLGALILWGNIAVMPTIVAFAGIFVALWRRFK